MDCKSENEQQEGYLFSYRCPYVPSFDYAQNKHRTARAAQ